VKRSKCTEEQTAFALKKAEVGTPVEEENSKLKRLVAGLSLDKAMLQDVVAKNVWSASRLQGR